jgi:hypothetical protein
MVQKISVADPDPRLGAFLIPGSGIPNMFFSDPGSRLPNPYFESLLPSFGGKSSSILCKLAQIFYKTVLKFVIFVAAKKVGQQIFFPFSFAAVVGSGIRDPRSGIRYG